jgi:hypothetical protein
VIPFRLEDVLGEQLAPIARRLRRLRLLSGLVVVFVAAALVAVVLRFLEEGRGYALGWMWPLAFVGVAAGAVWVWRRSAGTVAAGRDLREVARLIEAQDSQLGALLITAIGQAPREPGGRLSYMQEQLVRQALARVEPEQWAQAVPTRRLGLRAASVGVAAAVFGYCAITSLLPDLPSLFDDEYGLIVTPGDTQVERGNQVLVLARFERRVPDAAVLVVRMPGKPPLRLEMRRTMSDPVFGAQTPAVGADRIEYFIEHAGGRSRRFRVTTFQVPDLERLDARIEYPQQSAIPVREVTDARFLTVHDGARITLTARLSAPARTVTLEGNGLEPRKIELHPKSGKDGGKRVFAGTITPSHSQRYDVKVVDADGRSNPTPPRLSIDVHRNAPAQMALAFPGRDTRVSPLEEMHLEAKITDDTAVVAYGWTYRRAGQPEREVRLGTPPPGTTTVAARAQLALESLGVQPDDLISYHFWAEDRDGAGKVRRAFSDMYFAEVRPFEERFREASGGNGEEEEGGGAGGGAALADLVRRQKEVINATWRLERQARDGQSAASLKPDVEVVAKSQAALKEKVDRDVAEARDARMRTALNSAGRQMGTAHRQLGRAAEHPGEILAALDAALEAEQSAYGALLRLRDDEQNVGRGRQSGGGQGGESPELSSLELKQKDSRYETRRQAQSNTRAPRPDREALGRLEELARRQNALTERIKEAEAALQRKATLDEAEIERRLKRLREEQREVLADMDELARKMQEPGAGDATQREALARAAAELERIRAEAAAAGEALAKGETGKALGASARAQRELDRARERLSKSVAAGFEDEVRELRAQSRELDERQERVGQALSPAEPLSSTETRRLADELRRQTEATTGLLSQLESLSRESEASAPLLSRKLYEGLREAKLADVESALGTAGELLGSNLVDDGREAEGRARAGIAQLRKNVDSAAKGVLGDEAEGLRAAQAELDELIAQAAREAQTTQQAAAAPGATGGSRQPPASPANPAAGGPGVSTQPASDMGGGEEGPITGNAFRAFAERLRDVEDLIDDTRLRNQAAGVRDNVRSLRADYRASGQRPTTALLQQQVLVPLTELRTRLAEQLTRIERGDKLVPLDRDPIPSRYTDLVRRYWKSLSEGR